eukprot:8768870-Alexandrium_andersonii.AAC.1
MCIRDSPRRPRRLDWGWWRHWGPRRRQHWRTPGLGWRGWLRRGQRPQGCAGGLPLPGDDLRTLAAGYDAEGKRDRDFKEG